MRAWTVRSSDTEQRQLSLASLISLGALQTPTPHLSDTQTRQKYNPPVVSTCIYFWPSNVSQATGVQTTRWIMQAINGKLQKVPRSPRSRRLSQRLSIGLWLAILRREDSHWWSCNCKSRGGFALQFAHWGRLVIGSEEARWRRLIPFSVMQRATGTERHSQSPWNLRCTVLSATMWKETFNIFSFQFYGSQNPR